MSDISPHAVIEPGALVGEGCVVKAGAHLPPDVTLEQGVHVGANVAFVESMPPGASRTVVRADAWIGANATIYAGVVIASKAVVRPGAVVTRSVPPGAIVEGHPAAIVGYVNALKGPQPSLAPAVPGSAQTVTQTQVKGVTVHQFPVIHDLRGNLTVGEFEKQIPFTPLRYFMVFDVPNREVRGEHAHKTLHEFLICVRGNCAVIADDGHQKVEIALDSPQRGMYLPPMTWSTQYKYSPDALVLVFASHHYDPDDYIRDYGAFLSAIGVA